MAQGLSAAAKTRLNNVDEHYPYKGDAARALLDENPPAGPAGANDARLTASDFISHPIIDASEAYVEAQAAHVANPGDVDAQAAYAAAAEELIAARQRHRANRTSMAIIGFKGAE